MIMNILTKATSWNFCWKIENVNFLQRWKLKRKFSNGQILPNRPSENLSEFEPTNIETQNLDRFRFGLKVLFPTYLKFCPNYYRVLHYYSCYLKRVTFIIIRKGKFPKWGKLYDFQRFYASQNPVFHTDLFLTIAIVYVGFFVFVSYNRAVVTSRTAVLKIHTDTRRKIFSMSHFAIFLIFKDFFERYAPICIYDHAL